MSGPLQSVLAPGGPDARLLTDISWLVIIGAALIFVVVMALLAAALRRGRAAADADAAAKTDADANANANANAAGAAGAGATAAAAGGGHRDSGVHTRRWLLGLGAGIPAVLLLSLLAYSVWRTGQLSEPSSRTPLRITVIAHMWWWEIRYFDAASQREAVTANELHIPLGTPVYLALTSADVIHAFWLPSLAGKVDMVPGRLHGLTLRADRAGVYRGQCAEYCGAQHAKMALHLTAQPAQEFKAWLANQSAPAAASAGSAAPAAPAAAAAAPATPAAPAAYVAPAAASASAASADDAAGKAASGIGVGGIAASHAQTGSGRASGQGARVARGRDAFVAARCVACHSVRGLAQQPPQDAPKAPDLTHIGSRTTIAAGALPMNPGTLAAWIADPQAIKPGARMPSATVDAATVEDIAAWLESLK